MVNVDGTWSFLSCVTNVATVTSVVYSEKRIVLCAAHLYLLLSPLEQLHSLGVLILRVGLPLCHLLGRIDQQVSSLALGDSNKHIGQGWIEVCSSPASNLDNNFIERHRPLVWPIRCHGLDCIA